MAIPEEVEHLFSEHENSLIRLFKKGTRCLHEGKESSAVALVKGGAYAGMVRISPTENSGDGGEYVPLSDIQFS